jgi:DNA polymerase III subunit delta
VKADAARIERALDTPGPDCKLALLYGPDEAGSRALADRLAAAMGADAERVDLDGGTLKEDPARLPDEATAITMFGGPRWIRATGGDDCLRAVEALLEAPEGCPVVLVAGNLPKTSALLKLALEDKRVLAFQSWKPEGQKADAIATQTGRVMGVRLSPDAARLLADATQGDRALMMRELEKLALYVDASPDRPRPVERADIEAVGAAIDVREAWDTVDALFGGKVAELAQEISGDAAVEVIPGLRAIDRRALMIARTLSARRGGQMPRGNPREMVAVERESRHWSPEAAATAHRLAMEAEAAVKMPRTAGEVLAHATMLSMARAAARRR